MKSAESDRLVSVVRYVKGAKSYTTSASANRKPRRHISEPVLDLWGAKNLGSPRKPAVVRAVI